MSNGKLPGAGLELSDGWGPCKARPEFPALREGQRRPCWGMDVCIQRVWRLVFIRVALYVPYLSFHFDCIFKSCSYNIYFSQVQLLEMEKSHMHSRCEELKTEVEQLKSTSQQAGADVSTSSSAEEAVSYVDGERYWRLGRALVTSLYTCSVDTVLRKPLMGMVVQQSF